MKHKLRLAAFAILAAVFGLGHAAQTAERNDASAVSSARISLSQAIALAERHTGGKASRAELERHAGRWVYDVEVVSGSKAIDVAVDPTDGKILSATADASDPEDENDAED